MKKIIKNKLENFLVICLIFLMVGAWIFSGWPQIWQKPPVPPEIPEAQAQITIFYETFPNADRAWNGSLDTAQDEPGWVTIQGGDGDTNDIQVSDEDRTGGTLPPSGGNHLTFEDCDTGTPIPNTTNDLACVPIDLAGYTSVVIEYYWQSDDVDAGEWLEVSYSTDATDCTNGTWTQMGYFENPTDDTWYLETYNLPDADAVANFKLRFASKSDDFREHFYVDDIKLTGFPPVVPTITIDTIGSQVASMNIPSTNNYVGGAFTFVRDTGTADITQIIITEAGTVNANLNLSNLKLYYETAATCSFEGTEALFGSASSFDISEKATVSGLMSVDTSQVCVYVVLDVGSGAAAGQEIEIEITAASDVTVSAGTVSAVSWPVAIAGTTTLQVGPANWLADEDTSISGVNKNKNIRLRISVANTGSEATDYDYLLEYASKPDGVSCGDIESSQFAAVPVTATAGQHFEITDSIYFVNGDSTTAQFSNPEAYTFVTGKMIEDPSNSSGNITLPFENYTEIEFVFQANDNAIDGGSYCFRLTNAGTPLDDYPVYPELQIASP